MKYQYILNLLNEYRRIDEEHGILTTEQIQKICSDIFPEYDVKKPKVPHRKEGCYVRLLREREGTRGQRCGKTHQEIPWLAIKGMRNKIVHDDGYVDLTVVYDTVMHGIPEMYEKLKEIS